MKSEKKKRLCLNNCTRVEIIDEKGRSYVNWKDENKVKYSMQDQNRTLKIFISQNNETNK